MNNSPLVSIVVPSYNHSEYIEDTINSIINQDYENIELIIIDDGSTDSSVEKVKKMTDACKKRFHRFEFRHRSNKGICFTLNEAINWCQGEFLSCCASDDILLPDKTRVQVNYLEKNINSVGVFGTVKILFQDTGDTRQEFSKDIKYRFNDILLNKHNLPAPTQMLRTKKVRDTGGFIDGFVIEDWLMWLLITKNGGTLDCINVPFAIYRKHNKNISNNNTIMHEGRLQVLSVFRKHPKYKRSLSKVYRFHAVDIMETNPSEALNSLIKSIRIYPLNLLNKKYIKLIYKAKSLTRGNL